MKKLLAQFIAEEDGAAMVEYTILLGMITAAVILMVVAVGTWVSGEWTALNTILQAN